MQWSEVLKVEAVVGELLLWEALLLFYVNSLVVFRVFFSLQCRIGKRYIEGE